MAQYNYFEFNPRNTNDPLAGGELSAPVELNNIITTIDGTLCQPGEIKKLTPGVEYSTFEDYMKIDIDQTVTISGLTEQDWEEISLETGNTFKKDFIINWMNFLNLSEFTDMSVMDSIMNFFEDINFFKLMSGPSVAYLTQDPITLEVSLGLNSYNVTYWLDWINANSNTNYALYATQIRKKIKPLPHFITHIAKIQYSNTTEKTWSFDTRYYTEYSGDGVNNASLEVGGGNYFTEIKFAGLHYTINNNIEIYQTKAKYIVKKNIDQRDPTFGLCSGEGEPFCIGDQVFIIDTSILNNRIYTGSDSNSFTWTWIGTSSNIDRKWYIANVSNPCTDYTNVAISDMLFPLRAISECKFENFN